jgi:hypothetical protein
MQQQQKALQCLVPSHNLVHRRALLPLTWVQESIMRLLQLSMSSWTGACMPLSQQWHFSMAQHRWNTGAMSAQSVTGSTQHCCY